MSFAFIRFSRSLACSMALVGASLLPLFGHAQTAGAMEPVKIGVIGPFSGPSSDFGQPMLKGVELAFGEINSVGGYLGRPFELVKMDDQGKPDVALAASEKLVKQGVVATIGFCNTGNALRSIKTFQEAQIPLIVPCATGTPITATFPPRESYIFRTSARDAIQAPFVVGHLVKQGWNRVAIFADETGYGDAGLKDVVAALKARKLKPVYVARFPLGVKDLTAELQAARSAGANAIFSYTVGPENATIAKGREALNWNVPQVGAWPLSFPFFIKGAGAAAEGALMAQTFIAEPSNERRAAFLTAYSRAYQEKIPVPMAAAQSYDAAYLLTYALFSIRDGKFAGPSVKQALENIPRTYYGVVATYERPFSEQDKDALTEDMLVLGKVKNGAITFAIAGDARRNLFVKRKKTQ